MRAHPASVEAAGLSEPDLLIVIQLNKSGGRLRQSELAAALGWDRTRVSHQLTRMQNRGVLTREKGAGGVTVSLAPAGRELIEAVLPRLATAVREHFTGRLDPGELEALRSALPRL